MELQAWDRRLSESSFQWRDLDRRLISPKTNELAEEMQKRAREGERKIAFETAKSLMTYYWILAETGVRAGEIGALPVTNLLLDQGAIRICSERVARQDSDGQVKKGEPYL